jgi:hypothetical protein
MPQRAGSRLGPYEIVGLLGAGGMGEVYRARDTRLDRDVAIKVLPEHLAESAERRQRLAREARAISSLQHPNICALHDVGSENGVDFLVMEFLDGETLAERLRRGPVPVRELLTIAIALADALDKAHRRGVVHRDLKPGNVMLTRSGPKVLDFGLAKRKAEVVPPTEATAAVSLDSITTEGKLVGTFRYMSPEQVEGKEADARSDLFAFGTVLYEMATGKRAFVGNSLASVIAAVLDREPVAVHELQPQVPEGLDRVIRICLAKDPDDRFQSAHDLKLELERIRDGDPIRGGITAATRNRRKRKALAWGLAAVGAAAAVALGIGISGLANRQREEPILRFEVVPAPDTVPSLRPFEYRAIGAVTLSADGRHLAWVAADRTGATALWVRSLERAAAHRLEGTDGASFPFWSPDARALGFFAGGKLKRIDAAGGPTITLCEASGMGGAWNRDGVIVLAPERDSPIFRVDARGGVPAPVTELDSEREEISHRYPRFLPDNEHFLYLNRSGAGPETGTTEIWVASLAGGEPRQLIETNSQAEYAQGHLLFASGSSLVAQPFDADRLELRGEARPVLESLLVLARPAVAAFSVSQQGTLAYQEAGLRTELAWYDRGGSRVDTLAGAEFYEGVALSPDQQWVIAVIHDIERGDGSLWLFDLGTGIRKRFTFDTAQERLPVWSRDGRRVFFLSTRDRSRSIYVKEVDGSGEETLLYRATEGDPMPMSASPDGRFLAMASVTTQADLMLLPLDGSGAAVPLVSTEFDEFGAQISPDGRWVAYCSNESAVYEVYVQPFPGPGIRRQVSLAGGLEPRWRGDGRELLFTTEDGKLMSAEVDGVGDRFEVKGVQELFETPRRAPGSWQFDVTADGELFLMEVVSETDLQPSIRVVMNWTSELVDR